MALYFSSDSVSEQEVSVIVSNHLAEPNEFSDFYRIWKEEWVGGNSQKN
ncbi:MAG: hypothetical protein ACI85I_001594 [Arenicella sp.]|jgi:hypothetical protein